MGTLETVVLGLRSSRVLGSDRDFQVRGYYPPILKKIFFADLHDLVHERKKCENDPILTFHNEGGGS